MPDPSVTLAAIQSHSTALEGAIRRHAANAARCKVWSVGVVAGVIVFAVGRTQMAALPWAAAPVVLLALADACQVVIARCCTDAYNAFMRKLPLNGGNAMKAEECFLLPAPEPTWRQTGQVLGALGSLSVLPFYGALLALVVAFYVQMSEGQGDLEKGRLGDGETKSARLLPSAATGTAPSTVKTSLPKTVGPNPAPRGGQPPANGSPPTIQKSPFAPTTLQPGQPPTLSPLRPVQQQPGVRLPAQPQPRLQTNGVPPNTPANTAPWNGVLPNGVPPQPPAPVLPVPPGPEQEGGK